MDVFAKSFSWMCVKCQSYECVFIKNISFLKKTYWSSLYIRSKDKAYICTNLD